MRQYEESNLKEETTQDMLDLLVLSEIYNIDLPEALTKRIDKMEKRKRPPKTRFHA
jgi:NTP pyrophosphatase (non-canonical NTP hydrolase)